MRKRAEFIGPHQQSVGKDDNAGNQYDTQGYDNSTRIQISGKQIPIGQTLAKVVQKEAGRETAFALSERCNSMASLPVPLQEVALEATAKLLAPPPRSPRTR